MADDEEEEAAPSPWSIPLTYVGNLDDLEDDGDWATTSAEREDEEPAADELSTGRDLEASGAGDDQGTAGRLADAQTHADDRGEAGDRQDGASHEEEPDGEPGERARADAGTPLTDDDAEDRAGTLPRPGEDEPRAARA
jgi:hypothetical protein